MQHLRKMASKLPKGHFGFAFMECLYYFLYNLSSFFFSRNLQEYKSLDFKHINSTNKVDYYFKRCQQIEIYKINDVF